MELPEIELPEIELAEIEVPNYFPGQPASTKTALERAKKEGLVVVYPEPRQLQIDIDSESNLLVFVDQLAVLRKYVDVGKLEITPSLSGEPGHYHATITSATRTFSAWDRIFLQALLGSDLKREALGFLMLKGGEGKPTLFLEKK